jgi:phage shock protein PspC (stress-responsive transcriptional regulator)
MKKIININLSGRVIPIEDLAYENLQAYIESLRRYFINEEGRDEIINDIEGRVAELMNEKIRKGADCITDSMVEEIITSMGRPEDFEAEETATASGGVRENQAQQQSFSERKTSRGRLYRDTSDKFIGGVCSGIAAYLNVDPAIVRILFAIITFGGFGFGFVAYILLWIILPPKDLEGYSGKRLYRNPDDRIIGGVAGGLAAYFNMKTSTLRFIFAAPIILSVFINMLRGYSWGHDFDLYPNIVFGSLSGTFILAYIILWMVLPEARSEYEKMEMRGEKVDVNKIRQTVQDRAKEFGSDVKSAAQNISAKTKEFAQTRGKAFAQEVGETARRGGRGLGHAIGVLFKVFFLFIAGAIAFGLFVAFIALIFGGVAWAPINNFLWTNPWQQFYAWGTLIFFLGVPLIGFIVWIVRRIIRVRSRSNYLGWTFAALWTIGWVMAALFAASLSKDFREYEHSDSKIDITQPKNRKMIVAVSEPKLRYTGRFSWMNNESSGWDLTEDTLKMSTVKFTVRASADSQYHVVLKRHSFGRTQEEALERAEKIQYLVFFKDSVLDLGSHYAIDKNSKFRGQQAEIEIQVPVGKMIRFDKSVTDKLNPANFRMTRKYSRNRAVDIDIDTRSYFRFRTGVDYVMGIDGKLRDISTSQSKPSEEYRYNQTTDSTELQKQIEEKKQELKRLEELQKQQSGKPVSINTGPEKEKNIDLVHMPPTSGILMSWYN